VNWGAWNFVPNNPPVNHLIIFYDTQKKTPDITRGLSLKSSLEG